MTNKPALTVGSRVRHCDDRTVKYKWHGTIGRITRRTATVWWDELAKGAVEVKPPVGHRYNLTPGPDLLPLDCLEPIANQDRTVVVVSGEVEFPEQVFEWAFQHADCCPRQIWIDSSFSSVPALTAWAQRHGTKLVAHDDWQAMVAQVQLAQWSGFCLAIADGNPNPLSREIIKAMRGQGCEFQVLPLSALLHTQGVPSISPVEVINLRLHPQEEGSIYIGRAHSSGLPASPLHNPYKLDKHTRDEACDLFEAKVLRPAIESRAGPAWEELARLRDSLLNAIATETSLKLACHCAPQRCHGDAIAASLRTLAREKLGLLLTQDDPKDKT